MPRIYRYSRQAVPNCPVFAWPPCPPGPPFSPLQQNCLPRGLQPDMQITERIGQTIIWSTKSRSKPPRRRALTDGNSGFDRTSRFYQSSARANSTRITGGPWNMWRGAGAGSGRDSVMREPEKLVATPGFEEGFGYEESEDHHR